MNDGSVMVLDENAIATTPQEESEKRILYFIQCRDGVLEIYPGSGDCIKLKSKEEVNFLCDMLTRQSQTM